MAIVNVSPRVEIQKKLEADPRIGKKVFIGSAREPRRVRMQGTYILLRNVGEVRKVDYSSYAYQRVDVICMGNTTAEAEVLELITYEILDGIVGELPLMSLTAGGTNDIEMRNSDGNENEFGVFRPYKVAYVDRYDDQN